MSIRDYSRRLFCNSKWCGLRCNPSCLYSSTDNGLFMCSMPTKYHHFACFRLSTYLYVLFMCLYVRVLNKIADIRSLTCITFHFIFNFLPLLYMIETNACFHMGVVRSIRRPIYGIARQMGASNSEGNLGSRHL